MMNHNLGRNTLFPRHCKMILRTLFPCFILILAGGVSNSSLADVYKFVAPDGRIFYTDEPNHAGYKRIIRSKKPSHGATRLSINRKKFAPLIDSAASQHQLDPKLLHAVIRAESAYNPRAVSKKGAVGLMQLMPATARRYGVKNREDPKDNINGGAHYLKDLLSRFDSDIRLAVAAYNAGEKAVEKYGNSIPPFPETRQYVDRVLAFYRQ